MVDMEGLGYIVRDARELRRIRQDDLGKKVGLSRASISLIETGRIRKPRVELLQRLADALEIPVGPLLEKAGLSPLDAETGQFQWILEQLDSPNRKRLVGIAHALLQVQQDQPRRGGR